jgi:predicted dehydrogenase
MKLILLIGTLLLSSVTHAVPLRIGIAGMAHDHVHGILNQRSNVHIEIVGIAESNKEMAKKYSDRYGFSMSLVYESLEEMIEKTKPEAVASFGSILSHLEVVKICAPRGIHVMVEKPLAATLSDAKQMQALANQHKIQLLTNYETTWYGSNYKAHELVQQGSLGPLRKVVIHDGHEGPKEIGVSPEFLQWLTDPHENGGGAVIDFGCYGANLLTWLANGQRPTAVLALLQQMKPDVYPKVDDEATIVVEYPSMQGIIQASWNWPFGRKDMEVYGATGYVLSDNREKLRIRLKGESTERTELITQRQSPYDDPFALFAAVVQKKIVLSPYDLSSLENNMVVMEILDAAIQSARTGKKIALTK